ncbi:MAG: CHASE domain-containing protein [Gallionellaceae bacterium]|jgi:CHASE1-domain containing sensor protein/signal transduction histidine kinase
MSNELIDSYFAKSNAPSLFEKFGIPGAWVAWLVLLVSFSVTLGGWYIANTHAREAAQAQFNARSGDVLTQILQRIQASEFVLRGGAALFASSKDVSRTEWHDYVTNLKIDQHLTGIQGVGFAQHVVAAEIKQFTGQIRAEGFPDYAISPAQHRTEYTPIVYLEPSSGRNLRAFGYDMFSEPTRRSAMERARDTGELTISGKVTLVQETDIAAQPGFLMYLPVYDNQLPHRNQQERQIALLGYVYIPFRMHDLMSGIVGRKIPDMDIHIYDGEAQLPSSLMFESSLNDQSNHSNPSSFFHQTSIFVGGRQWTVVAESLAAFDAAIAKKAPTTILLMGILISLLLFFIARVQERSRKHAAHLAKDMAQAYKISEQHLQALLNQTPAILWTLDSGLRFTSSQGMGLAALNLIPGQIVGMRLNEYLQTNDMANPIMAAAQQALLGKEGEFNFASNGVSFHNSVKPLKDEQGQIVGVLGIAFDVTALVRAQAELRWIGRLYRLLSQVNETIVRADNRVELFSMICRSAVASGLFRLAWIGMLDKREHEVIPVAHAGFEDGYLEKLHIRLDNESTRNGPTATAIRTGSHVISQDIQTDPRMLQWREAAIQRGYHSSAAFPIFEHGSVVGAVNVYAEDGRFFSSDIVELMLELSADISFALEAFAEKQRREHAESELKQLNLELERRVLERTHELKIANHELEAFSYSVSHDLRAPLRSIDGFSQILLNKYQSHLDATGTDYLQRVRRASQRMGLLIDDLLQLSRVTRSSLKREQVNISAIAETVAEELRKTNAARQVNFILQPGLFAYADPGLMSVVLNNLLGNAYKFSSKKNHSLIEFGLCNHDGEPAFFVRDNGDGFNMEYANKLFGAFQRLHGTNEFEGTGIGLATVQRIIHRHHGKVWAEGKVGEGATFYFSLPQRMRETEEIEGIE